MARLLWVITLFATILQVVQAADWPQWRGPDRTGVSKETGLLGKWPEQGPPLVWSVKNAGLGFSSFAVRDGKAYTLGSRGEEEIILAYDAAKGTELWVAKIGPIVNAPENPAWGDGPRGTPTLDGNSLFALGSQGDLVCVDLSKNGAELWRKNLVTDFGGELMTGWGYSESPLVDGDRVIVTPGGNKGTVVALDKKSGQTLWQTTELTHKAPYSSAVVAEIHGVRQYIQLSYIDEFKGGFVNGIAAKDGKLLWQASIFKQHSYAAAPTPIVQDNFVYITTGYGGGCHLFELDASLKPTDRYSQLVQKRGIKNTHGGVVLLGNKIYGHSEGLGWACQDLKTGKIAWNEKDKLETRSGAITAAEDMLYLYTEEGQVGLVKASPEGFEEVSTFKIPETSKYPATRKTSRASKAWNHPVIANGHLFVRDAEMIYCYDIRAKK